MSRIWVLFCLVCMLVLPQIACADVVIDWNNATLNVIKNNNVAPPPASRTLAMVHAAIYDSVNAIYGKYEPYQASVGVTEETSPVAAAATAAYTVLASLYPNQIAYLDSELAASLAQVNDGPAKTRGIALGEYVGNAILAWRMNDNSNLVVPYTPGTDPGDWQPTPPGFKPALLPNWPYVTPFAMTSGSQFRLQGPPPLTSIRYAMDFNEVKAVGKAYSVFRTEDQTQIAYFWADADNSVSPPGRWNIIAQTIAERKHNTIIENARLFALLNIAEADAAIVAWDAKYAYNFWRPITAIRNANSDGNPLTKQDSNWVPLLVTPPFPEYVSGHSTFAGSGATILALFFGRDSIPFVVQSTDPLLRDRFFISFSQAAYEDGRSRIYSGIHFQFSNLDGLSAGRQLGSYVWENFLTPVYCDAGDNDM